MKDCNFIIFACICAFVVSCSAFEEWDGDYYDIHADSAENDEYPISYSPTFQGHFSDPVNFIITEDETGTTNDLEENTIPTLPDEPVRPAVDDTETVINPKESAAIEKLRAQVDKLMSEVKTQQDKITELENANKKLQSKVDFVEEQTKTNSLIFFNVHENERENHRMTLSKVLYVINKQMRVRLGANDISVALRANPADSSNSTQYRPIVVRMVKFADKMRVVAAAGRLSHTNIVVAVDYSERVAQVRRQLLPYLEEARALGRRAFLLYDSLVVDGERVTLDQLQATATTPSTPAAEDDMVEQVEVEVDVDSPVMRDDFC